MKALVGYTGFVGQNIDAKASFEGRYNSKNVEEAYGTEPDLLVYAGMSAEKYLANHEPERDYAKVREAFDNIRLIAPKRLVLISSADVYASHIGVDEDTEIVAEEVEPYGRNRYLLERGVRELCPDALIVRLPALYGMGIKKNFVYDMIKLVPFMLTDAKRAELMAKDSFMEPYYEDQGNGFWRVSYGSEGERLALRDYFSRVGFSALNFTDSRSRFQFYPLARLWDDIQVALANDLRLLNITTEPVSAAEVYGRVRGEAFENELPKPPADYDIHSRHAALFGGSGPYMLGREWVLEDLAQFILASN